MIEYKSKTFFIVLIATLVSFICMNLIMFFMTGNIRNIIPIMIQAIVLTFIFSKYKIQLIIIRIWAILVLLTSLTKWLSWLLHMKIDGNVQDFDSFNIIVNFAGLLLPMYLLMFLSESVERKEVQKVS